MRGREGKADGKRKVKMDDIQLSPFVLLHLFLSLA